MRLAFITNNAARPPAQVAEHLRELGVDGRGGRRGHLGPGRRAGAGASASARARRVALLGADGLRGGAARRRASSRSPCPTRTPRRGDAATAPTCRGATSCGRAVRIRDGLPWVASNTDRTIPTAYGVAPGHGVLVETIRELQRRRAGRRRQAASGRCWTRPSGGSAGERPLMVGDRLDTDIEGARNAGLDSLLVLTGVTGLAELVGGAGRRSDRRTSPPTSPGCSSRTAPRRTRTARSALGGWRARVESGRLVVERARASPATGGASWPRRPGHLDDGEPSTRPGRAAARRSSGVASGHD